MGRSPGGQNLEEGVDAVSVSKVNVWNVYTLKRPKLCGIPVRLYLSGKLSGNCPAKKASAIRNY